MEKNSDFCLYGGFEDEVYGFEERPANNYDFYYPVMNYEYTADYFYYPTYVYVPVYCHYFVPSYTCYVPRYENIVSGTNSFEQGPFYENTLMSPSVEPSMFTTEVFDSSLYNIEYGSFNDGSVENRVGEEITTCDVSYVEYPEKLDGAENEDEDKSVSSDKELVENIILNGADVDEITVVGQPDEPLNGVCMNICDEDVDEKVIKKVSLMSIEEVKEDIDENYEDGKAFLYNQVIKGYTENKNTLEELQWECHTLDDILEEEEPDETDSDEMDFNEHVLKNIYLKEDLKNNDFSRVDDESYFESYSISKESLIAPSEEGLLENQQIRMEGNQTSTDSSNVGSVNGETDPILERPISKEKLNSESMNGTEDNYPPVDSPVSEVNERRCAVPEVSSSEEIDSTSVSVIKDQYPTGDLPASEENHKILSAPDVCLRKEEIDSGTVSSTEDVYPSINSPVMKENSKMNSVRDLCLTEEEINHAGICNIEELEANVSSQGSDKENRYSAASVLEPAASKTTKQKKRFSSVRKFFARICCCSIKKPS